MKNKTLATTILATAIVATLTGCGSSAPAESTSNDTADTQIETSAEEDVPEENVSDNKFRVGDTIYFEQANVIVKDAGKYEYSGHTYAYVDLEISNKSDEEFGVYAQDTKWYVDDYASNPTVTMNMVDVDALTKATISPGRKAAGKFFTECDYDAASSIEMEFYGEIISIKEDGNEVVSESNHSEDTESKSSDVAVTTGSFMLDCDGEYAIIDITNPAHVCLSYYDPEGYELSYLETDLTATDDSTFEGNDGDNYIEVTFYEDNTIEVYIMSDDMFLMNANGWYDMQ